jgi:hypothetical protein
MNYVLAVSGILLTVFFQMEWKPTYERIKRLEKERGWAQGRRDRAKRAELSAIGKLKGKRAEFLKALESTGWLSGQAEIGLVQFAEEVRTLGLELRKAEQNEESFLLEIEGESERIRAWLNSRNRHPSGPLGIQSLQIIRNADGSAVVLRVRFLAEFRSTSHSISLAR